MWIYADGSNIDGHVEVIAWCRERQWMSKAYTGTTQDSTVYLAEVIGISEAPRLAIKQVTIFTDNQASILSSKRPRL
jgi:hypothetical protein